MKHMEPEAEPAQSSRSRARAICEETRDLHEALPAAPSGTPADMTYVTMRLPGRSSRGSGSHTFVGPPDQVNTWLEYMRSGLSLGISGYLIVFREYEHGVWGESVSSETGFLPGRHYRVEATREADPSRAPCQFCPPRPHGLS